MAYYVKLCAVVDLVGAEAGDPDVRAKVLEAHVFDVMDHLADLEGDDIFDADLNAELTSGQVEITIGVRVADPVAATDKGLAAIRTAVHAAGGFTPDFVGEAPPSGVDWGLRYTGHRQELAEPAGV